MPVPLWMQIVYGHRPVDPTQGFNLRSYTKGDFNTAPLSLRGAQPSGRGSSSRGSSRKKTYSDDAAGVIARLQDQGLSAGQIAKITSNQHEHHFNFLSPSDYLGKAGDVLGTVINKLDVPRAYTESALIEGTDVLGALADKIPGVDFTPIQGSKNLRQTGVSWQDFIQNAQNRVSFGDVLEGNKDKNLFGVPMDNKWAKLAATLGVDTAIDPLMYLGVGEAEEPRRIATLFRKPEAVEALGKEAADEAAKKVLREGVNSLSKEEFAAIGKRGGLYAKVPGTGVVGRLTGLEKALQILHGTDEIPRAVTIAERGTKLGDLASEAAQGVRKYTGLNAALRTVGKAAGAEGLAGNLPRLRAALRGDTEHAIHPLDALLTLNKEAEGRHVAEGFELQTNHRLGKLLRTAKNMGVNGTDLWHAVGGDTEAAKKVPGELLGEFSRFFEETRQVANERAGRQFVRHLDDYTPRFLTPEAREAFAKGAKGGKRDLLKTLTGRGLKAGDRLFGEELIDPAVNGTSIEKQIEGIVSQKRPEDAVKWFKDDAYQAFPQYVKTLSRKLQDEYVGNQLVDLGVGKEMYKPTGDFRETAESVQRRTRNFQRQQKAFQEATHLTNQFEQAVHHPIPWDEAWAKFNRNDVINLEPEFTKALQNGFKQFSTHAQLPEDIVGAFRDIGKMSEPGALRKVMDIHDRLMTLWKKLALFTPGFHMRNAFGGVWMNWVADVDEGRYLQLEKMIANDPESAPFFGRRRYNVPQATKLLSDKKIDPMVREGYEEAKKLGVFTGNQSFKEIERVGDPEKLSGFQAGRQLGGAIENRLRGAMFIDEYVKTGGDASAAFQKMMKYHFDYEALGNKEEAIRRFGIPFYTFTRRAVPVMAEMLIRNPSKVSRYFRLKDDVERMSPEESLVPDYFSKQFAMRLPWQVGGKRTYYLPDLPLFSLIDSSDPNLALGQLSPFIKTPYEVASGKQIWKGIPLDEDPVEVPTYLKWMTPALKALGHLRTDADGREVMSEKDMYLLSQFLPQIGQARRLLPTEDRYKERQLTSILSFVFGIGTRTNTDREQKNELIRREQQYDQDIKNNANLGYGRDAARALAYGTP